MLRLVAREALSSSTRLRRILARFMTGHVPLLLETIVDGIGAGDFDDRLPPVLVWVAVVGLGGVPQLIRHATQSIPFFAALEGAEALADASINLVFRATGAAPEARAGSRPAGPAARRRTRTTGQSRRRRS